MWKLSIEYRKCNPWNLINNGNGKYKKVHHKIIFDLCLYKGIGVDG